MCALYDKTASLSPVNELRKELFCKRSKMMEVIIKFLFIFAFSHSVIFFNMLKELYIRRVAIWTIYLQSQRTTPSPEKLGWK